MTIIAERIRKRRIELGMSQMALAIEIKSNPTQVSRYEHGQNDPTGMVLVMLAKALRTSTDYLLGLVDDPTPRSRAEDVA
jgi:transcriptional regulator with XRE-family HTH domain